MRGDLQDTLAVHKRVTDDIAEQIRIELTLLAVPAGVRVLSCARTPCQKSVVIWLIQLLPEGDALCCSVWASLIAEGGIVMAYVPIGVSMALRKYLSPTCSKLSCAWPV